MKKIFAIAWKDAIIRFSSVSQLLFFIILPVVFTVLLAGGTPSGNEDNRIRLLVVDDSQTAVSQEILAELKNSTAVRIETVSLDKVNLIVAALQQCLSSHWKLISRHYRKVLQKSTSFNSLITLMPPSQNRQCKQRFGA